MNLQRQRTVMALSVLALITGLSTFTVTLAQHKIASRPTQIADKVQSKQAIAHNLAMERYSFAKRLERRFGFFPVSGSIDVNNSLLFPSRRSDRVYVLLDDANVVSPETRSTLLCYQRTDSRDKLVYKVNLKCIPSIKNLKIKSLLTYLHSHVFFVGNENGREVDESYAVKGRIANFAKYDLAKEQDYIQYNYIPAIDTLVVRSFSDLEHRSFYFLERSNNGKKLRPGVFYKRYGLPAAKTE